MYDDSNWARTLGERWAWTVLVGPLPYSVLSQGHVEDLFVFGLVAVDPVEIWLVEVEVVGLEVLIVWVVVVHGVECSVEVFNGVLVLLAANRIGRFDAEKVTVWGFVGGEASRREPVAVRGYGGGGFGV